MQKVKLFLIRFLCKKYITHITEEDVLRVIQRSLYIGETKLTDEEVGALKEEASALLNSALWRYARRNIEYLATMKLGKQAQNREDIIMGNSMFYNVQVIEEFLTRLSKL